MFTGTFQHFTRHIPLLPLVALVCLALWLPVPSSGQSSAAEPQRYILATATTGGTYYPVGVALSTLTKVRLEPNDNIVLIDVTSPGSGENIRMLRDNTAQFAILQGLYGAWAWNGAGSLRRDGPQTHLRSITMLWQNVEHFIIKSDFVKSGNMSDLAGLRKKRLSLGQINSGTEGSGLYILERLGFAGKDFQSAPIDYGSNAAAIQNGTIDGMNIPGGPPVGAVTQAFATLGKDITVLDFSEAQLAAVNSVYPLWNRFIIAAGTYPGQDRRIVTIAQPNFLAVRSDVDDRAVYLIVKTIYQNLALLRIIHPATEAMALDKAIEGLPLPLHPGAARFYREQGIDIPDYLLTR